jgi:hypothetical protein
MSDRRETVDEIVGFFLMALALTGTDYCLNRVNGCRAGRACIGQRAAAIRTAVFWSQRERSMRAVFLAGRFPYLGCRDDVPGGPG